MSIFPIHKNARVAAALFCALALAGCAKKTIVGKWEESGAYPTGQSATAITEYKSDGTLLLNTQGPGGPAESNGTYKVTGDQLTQTYTDFKTQGTHFTNLSQTDAPAITFKIDGDTLTLTYKGKSRTMTRLKE